MLLVLSVRLASTIHYYLQAFAPTNVLLRRLRTRGGLKWAISAGLLLVPTYLFAAAITTAVIADGGPGWLNLMVLICIWNAIKFASIALFSPVLRVALFDGGPVGLSDDVRFPARRFGLAWSAASG